MKQLLGDLTGRILVLTILLAVLILAVVTLKILLVPLVAASFVAYLFDPAIMAMQRRGISRGLAFLALFAVFVIGILTLLWLAPSWLRGGGLKSDTSTFSETLEKQLAELESSATQRMPILRSVNIAKQVNDSALDLANRLFAALPGLITSFTLNLILVPFIAYFMVRDGRNLRRRIVSLVPNRYFEMSLMMLHRIDQQIGGYLRGRLIECTLVAITQMAAMGIVLIFVPQPNILLISAVIGVTNMIPYLGPAMGAGFGIALYLGSLPTPMPAVYGLVIATVGAHLVDNIAIAPLVLSHNVDLHPLTVALVLVIGGELLGVLGLLIAIPVAASLKVVGQEVYANYQLQARLSG